jgi:dihydroorotase
MQCYAQVFDEEGRLENLEAFASINGPRFYGFPLSESLVTLKRGGSGVTCTVAVEDDVIVPFRDGEPLAWTLAGEAREASS